MAVVVAVVSYDALDLFCMFLVSVTVCALPKTPTSVCGGTVTPGAP